MVREEKPCNTRVITTIQRARKITNSMFEMFHENKQSMRVRLMMMMMMMMTTRMSQPCLSKTRKVFATLEVWVRCSQKSTVNGSEIPSNHLGCIKPAVHNGDKLPISTGDRRMSAPSIISSPI